MKYRSFSPLLPLKLSVLLACSLVVSACQSPVPSEQQVVKALPTNPSATPTSLKADQRQNVSQGDPRFIPVRDMSASSIKTPTGSLFNEEQYTGLFLHKRQYNIGDMVQVMLEEEIKAKKQQSLNKDKEANLNLDPNVKAGFIELNNGNLSIDHRQSSSFSSSSDSNQSNSLEGIVNVFVNEILNNGNLIVSGEKWIKLNEGTEYIRVFGEVRIKDIDANNKISSTKLGNALIEYSGKGTPQDNQDPSVVSKILSIFQ